MEKKNIFKVLSALTTTLASFSLLTACSGGSGDVEVSGGSTLTGSVSYYAVTAASGKNVSGTAPTLITNGTTMTVQGTCARGVSGARATVNGTPQTFVSCDSSAFFNYSLPIPTEGASANTLVFEATDSSGNVLSGSTGFTLTVSRDTIAPVPVNISVTGGTPASVTAGTTQAIATVNDNILLEKTGISSDAVTVRIIGNGETVDTAVSGSAWSYTAANLPAGVMISFDVYELDAAGNISSATTLQVTSTPTFLLSGSQMSFGIEVATSTAGDGLQIEATVAAQAFSTGVQTVATGVNGYTGNISIVSNSR
jgi:hypothetical protein